MQGTDSDLLATLGGRLARQRLARGLTQAALAQEAGVSKRTVERIEAGESTQTTNALRVLRALELLGGLDHLVPEPPASPMAALKEARKQRKRARGSESESVQTHRDAKKGDMTVRETRQNQISPQANDAPSTSWTWADDS